MKNHAKVLVAALTVLTLIPAYSQPGRSRGGMGPGGAPGGPDLGGEMAKLFGENKSFTATLEIQSANPSGGQTITMTGKQAFDDGKTRFEMDMSNMKGAEVPPEHMAQLKSMGMDKMVMISRPDKKLSYLVYPGLQGYVEMPIRNPEAAKPASDFKVEFTELGKETIDGHPCIKSKAVVTDDEGKPHESIVWQATDLKKFPVKIETGEQGHKATLLFKNVNFSKPDSGQFEPPSDYKKHDNVMSMMMQRTQGMGGMGNPHPGGQPPRGE